MIYLDNASSKPVFKELINYLKQSDEFFFGDSLQKYQFSINTRAVVEQARIEISNLLKVAPRTIFFTPNGTYANNLAINCIDEKIKTIITSKFEHKSVLLPLLKKAEENKIPVIFIDLLEDSGIDFQKIKKLISENPFSFVSLAHINRLTGRLLPLKRVAVVCKEYNSVFHSDMSHTIGKLNNDLDNSFVDLATASSHKFGGIRGAGFIYIKSDIKPNPVVLGEQNEYGIVAGSENIISSVLMAKALELSYQNISENFDYVVGLKEYLKNCLIENNISFKSVSFLNEHFLPHIVNIELNNITDFNVFLTKMDLNNVCISDGRFEEFDLKKNIRISFSEYNTKQEIENFCRILKNVLM